MKNALDKSLISKNIETLQLIVEAFQTIDSGGDIDAFCETNSLNKEMVISLTHVDWSFITTLNITDDRKNCEFFAPIEDLHLSVRPYNSLKRAGIHTVDKLLCLDHIALGRIHGLGKTGQKEVIESIEAIGIVGWPL